MLKTLLLENFTTFDHLEMQFSRGLNVIIGENGTGKTHVMKAAYAVCRPNTPDKDGNLTDLISQKLTAVFKPQDNRLAKLVKRRADGPARLKLEINDYEDDAIFDATFSNRATRLTHARRSHFRAFSKAPVFFPTKEVLSFFNGFVSLYDRRELSFDETYRDICSDLETPQARAETMNPKAAEALKEIEGICGGKFLFNGGDVRFHKSPGEEFSTNLIAEGFRKLGVLYRLLENQSLSPGRSGPLFWDEPEANLNPKLLSVVVKILLELSRLEQQVVLSTHNYVLLKEIELGRRESDQILYHGLSRDTDSQQVIVSSQSNYLQLTPNAIADAYSSLYDRGLDKSLGGIGQ